MAAMAFVTEATLAPPVAIERRLMVVELVSSPMAHTTSFRVRFGELDPYRHVNHTVYIAWLEAGRVEALEDHGLGLDRLQDAGIQIVITEVNVKFRAPAVAGDLVTIETSVAEIRRASSVWTQRVLRGRDELVTAQVRVAICDDRGRPTRPPAGLLEQLAAIGA
jgi:acyl-CoA thioester hydrolase